MNIGRLNKRITLLKPDMVSDGQGGQKPNPDNLSGYLKTTEVWADVQNPKIRPHVVSDAVVSDAMLDFWIRYYPEITTGWRVEHEGRTFDVSHAYSEQRIKTVITCREVKRIE